MPQRLHQDYETFSLADLKKVGAYHYARHPSTEILCAAFALDDQPPMLWHPAMSDRELAAIDPYFDALENPEIPIYAFNAQFEITIGESLMEKTWGIKAPDIHRYHCIQSIARRANLPASLDKLSEVLGNKEVKDKKGKKLIKLFCEMQKDKDATKHKPAVPAHRVWPKDRPKEFAEFLAYCAQDVRTDQEALRKLSYFEDAFNDANFTLTAVINARGVPVNLPALQHAQKLIDEETEVVSAKFRELTGINITQGAEFLKWLHGEGVHLDDLQAETIEVYLKENT